MGWTGTIYAGTGAAGYLDGPRLTAKFDNPSGLAAADGTLYVADQNNHRIRAITGDTVSTFAGSGATASTNGTGIAAAFLAPGSLTADSSGDLWLSDYHLIRKITAAGVVTTLAGNPSVFGGFKNPDDDYPGSPAKFNGPAQLVPDGSGGVWVPDANNHRIRHVTAAGAVSTLAGQATAGLTNGTGAAAQFNTPLGMAMGPDGVMYVADAANYVIRKVTTAGVVTTFVSGLTDYITGLAFAPDGTLYATTPIGTGNLLAISAGGAVSTLVAQPVGTSGAFSLAVTAAGALYAESYQANRVARVQFIAPDPIPPTHVPPEAPPIAPDFGTDYPDSFDPGATFDAAGAETLTVLDAIRQFSAAVRRAVRLTSASSIEMVDLNDPPLPTGWDPADADTLYHSSVLAVAASGETLRLAAGTEAVTVAAELVTDDVRLITSDWQLPNQLPVYGPGLRPAPVKQVSYTMTPKTFTASVEFAFPAVPAVVRR